MPSYRIRDLKPFEKQEDHEGEGYITVEGPVRSIKWVSNKNENRGREHCIIIVFTEIKLQIKFRNRTIPVITDRYLTRYLNINSIPFQQYNKRA